MSEEAKRKYISLISHVGLIILRKSGVIYSNQVGGYHCFHPEVEGVFYPLNIYHYAKDIRDKVKDGEDLYELLYEDLDRVIGLNSRYHGWCDNGISAKDADKLDDIFKMYELPFMVDRTRLTESMEAWVYVIITGEKKGFFEGFVGEKAIFVYPNSD